ncbi:MAG: glutathione S-transferase N-terminal domain-containing protein [Proteobacteria bacterium]|nr:glutathione S-transferase N-terminal domain-containing protein [Pseudomonadota bacterium]
MIIPARGRSIISVYSVSDSYDSHRIRFLLKTKNISSIDVIEVDPLNPPEDLIHINPYHTTPTVVDRDLALYGTTVITEYLDERYPHPPLMPPDPVTRAKLRLYAYRIEKDWLSYIPMLENGTVEEKKVAVEELTAKLNASIELFSETKFFLSDEMTLVDTCLAPFLWRLEHYGLDWEELPKPIRTYAHMIFRRDSFKQSVSEQEREMRFDF